MSCQQRFTTELRGRGMRLTPQREMVLWAMHDLDDHATPDEIYQRVHERSTAVDISTVYRTLELFQELGMLASCEGADGQRRYALAEAHADHIHLVCQACGYEVTAAVDPARAFAAALRAGTGFVLDINRLVLPGFCAACAAHSA